MATSNEKKKVEFSNILPWLIIIVGWIVLGLLAIGTVGSHVSSIPDMCAVSSLDISTCGIIQ